MLTKEEALQRNEMLKKLREEHKETIERTRELLKEQKAARQKICSAMRSGSKTVVEIAAASELPAHEVLWHITAMKKYELVAEVGKCGDYYQYAMLKEVEA